jgi:hypothetical protein
MIEGFRGGVHFVGRSHSIIFNRIPYPLLAGCPLFPLCCHYPRVVNPSAGKGSLRVINPSSGLGV